MAKSTYEKFQVGNTVVLKSGGPLMTIEDVSPQYRDEDYKCTWFNGKKREQGYFIHEILKKHEEPSA